MRRPGQIGRRGVMLTSGMLLLLLSAVALIAVFSTAQTQSGMGVAENTAAAVVNNRFRDVVADAVSLGKTESARGIFERVLPFSYEMDENRMVVISGVPVRAAELEHYYDVLNMYAVFVGDANAFALERNLDVNASTVQNYLWGGNTNLLRFVVLPQCSVYEIRDYNHVGFSPGSASANGCDADYNSENLLRYDLNINIKYDYADYNVLGCTIAGYEGCPAEDFNALDTRPYFRVGIEDGNCVRCMLGGFPDVISAHYNDGVGNYIELYCVGGACTSEKIKVTIRDSVSVDHNSTQMIEAALGAEFRNAVDEFEFVDFNVEVYREDFGVRAVRRIG